VHKASVVTRERDVAAREAALAEKESQFSSLLATRDTELASLRALLATAEDTHQTKVREALQKREDELRVLVMKQESEVAARMARREEEIMDAVRRREEEIHAMWTEWERETREGMANAVEERMRWVHERTAELETERERLLSVQAELERRCEQAEKELAASRREGKTPLENVKNLMRAPLWDEQEPQQTPLRASKFAKPPVFETPMGKGNAADVSFVPPSAMKGVVLTSTGEKLATPSPAEFAKLFMQTPKVKLEFAQIFDFDSEGDSLDGYETDTRAPSTVRGIKRERAIEMYGSESEVEEVVGVDVEDLEEPDSEPEEDLESTPRQVQPVAERPTRLRRPSIRASSSRPLLDPSPSAPVIARSKSACSATSSSSASSSSSARTVKAKSRSRPPSSTGKSERTTFMPTRERKLDPPEYDMSDEENLPSPFLKRVDRDKITRTTSVPAHAMQHQPPHPPSHPSTSSATSNTATASRVRSAPRKSGANTLRAVAVVNAANAAGGVASSKSSGTLSSRTIARSATVGPGSGRDVRGSIQKAQRASEDARKALFRP
jgi:NIMA (never in mitosis gene a)-related kinase 2